jgi:hypothetical protein
MGLVLLPAFFTFFLVPILCMGMNSRKTLASVLVESEFSRSYTLYGNEFQEDSGFRFSRVRIFSFLYSVWE